MRPLIVFLAAVLAAVALNSSPVQAARPDEVGMISSAVEDEEFDARAGTATAVPDELLDNRADPDDLGRLIHRLLGWLGLSDAPSVDGGDPDIPQVNPTR